MKFLIQQPQWDEFYKIIIEGTDNFGWMKRTHDLILINIILKIPKIKDVLEVGCGLGHTSEKLYEVGYSVEALDICPLAIEKANLVKTVNSTVKFIVGDFFIHDFDKTYDLVFDRCTYHMCTEKEDAENFINRVYSLLPVEGYWLTTILDWDKAFNLLEHHNYAENNMFDSKFFTDKFILESSELDVILGSGDEKIYKGDIHLFKKRKLKSI